MRTTSRTRWATLAVATAIVAALTSACGSGSASGHGDVITLRFAHSFPEGHLAITEIIEPYMEAVEKASDGRIEFEHYPSEQLAPAADLLDATQANVTDIGYIAPLYMSEDLPLSSIGALPGAYPNAEVGAVAYQDLVTGSLYDAEIKEHGVTPLFSLATGTYQIATTDEEVLSVNDVSGLRLRTSGGYQEMTVSELGGVGVSLPGPELYQATQSGTVGGTLIAAESIKPYGLDELVTSVTTNLSLGGFAAFFAINDQVWETIPADLQEIMLDEGERITKVGGAAFADAEANLLKDFKANGMSVNELPVEEVEKFAAVNETVQEAWVEDMAERGLPAQDVLNEFLALTQ